MMSVKNCVETNEKGAAVKATYTMKMKGRFRSTSETVANHAVATPRDDGKNGPWYGITNPRRTRQKRAIKDKGAPMKEIKDMLDYYESTTRYELFRYKLFRPISI